MSSLSDRQAIYLQIEQYRKRPLIVYATSTRSGVNARIGSDAVREFIDQIDAIVDGDSVDVLLHSIGGDGLTAWKIMSTLRERFDGITVLVPYMAFSAATLFALGANEIFMHPHASLGPIDPQITVTFKDGTTRQFSFEDVGAFLRFLNEEAKIEHAEHKVSILEQLFAAVDPVGVGAAVRASELSTSVGERLLKTHMLGEGGDEAARQIAENLNKSFFAHGDAVSRTRAKEMSLKIMSRDRELERLIWEAYCGIEELMQLREPFSPLQHIFKDEAAAALLSPAAPLMLPSNTPAPIAQQAWQAAASAALQQQQAAGGAQVDVTLINAVIESTRTASIHESRGSIFAIRMPDGSIQTAVNVREAAWFRA